MRPCSHAFSRYEKQGKGRKTVKAQALWYAIIESQTETGTPYMLYKDHCNRKSNQQNLGTIKCSNLCTEIVEYSSADEVSLCFTLLFKSSVMWNFSRETGRLVPRHLWYKGKHRKCVPCPSNQGTISEKNASNEETWRNLNGFMSKLAVCIVLKAVWLDEIL